MPDTPKKFIHDPRTPYFPRPVPDTPKPQTDLSDASLWETAQQWELADNTDFETVFNLLRTVRDQARAAGRTEMLDSIRASVHDYPKSGGDVEVMKAIDGISGKARREERKRTLLWAAEKARTFKAGLMHHSALQLAFIYERAAKEEGSKDAEVSA